MGYVTVTTEVEVDVDLSEIDTEDLQDELNSRFDPYDEVTLPDDESVLRYLWEFKYYHPEKFDEVFARLCGDLLGKSL